MEAIKNKEEKNQWEWQNEQRASSNHTVDLQSTEIFVMYMLGK